MPLTSEQQSALDLISSSRVSLLTGGPGVGKTYTLAHHLRTLKPGSYFNVAPTGRAAQRMMEAMREAGVRASARTIHSTLWPTRNGHDGDGWAFGYNRFSPLPCDTLIADECSMADSYIMASLLEACQRDTRIILVGDPWQLPPVGTGCPFLDMIDSGVIPHAHLTQIHRFAGRIAHVCRAVHLNEPWEPSPELILDNDAGPYGPENFRHIERPRSLSVLDTLEYVIDSLQERGFNPFSDIQVLCSRNDTGPLCRNLLNEMLQLHLNPHGERLDGVPFWVGDRMMCLRNGFRKVVTKTSDGKFMDVSEVYLANGEQGTCAHIRKDAVFVRFGKSLVRFSRPSWNEITLAYAITVWKAQGGGWPVIITVIDDGINSDRSMWYTALSRASKICITIGRMELLRRQCRKVEVETRKTFLKERLQEVGDRNGEVRSGNDRCVDPVHAARPETRHQSDQPPAGHE